MGREPPRADRLGVFRGARSVLREPLREAADRRRSKPDQDRGGIVGIALEIPPQRSGLQRAGHAVLGLGEVVDPDLDIAVPDKQLARGFEQGQPFLGRGHRVRRDHLLTAAHPRDMGIAVKRHAVGRQGQKLLHRIGDARAGLERQAIQDVGVQTGHTPRADAFGDVAGQVIALLAPDGLLDLGVEVLHPDRGAVHPRRGQRIQPGIVDLVRVDLDRKLAIRRHRRDSKDRPGQIAHQVCGQKRRRPAPPVQPRKRHAARQDRPKQRDFGFQRLDIGHDRRIRRGALRATGAKPAQPAAEGHMQIQGYLAAFGYRLDPARKNAGIDVRGKVRGGRIRRVAGHTCVEKTEASELRVVVHVTKLAVTES